MFEEAVKFMDKEWIKVEDVPTAEQWVKECTWMRGHSGNQRVTDVYIDGKRMRTRRDGLCSKAVEEMHIMQKSEGGKIRAVVKTGNQVNRQMDYVSMALEKGLSRSRISTLFAGSQGNEEIDWDIVKTVERQDLWKVPLDQSNFDQKQSKPTIWAVLMAIGVTLEKAYGRRHDIMKVWASMWKSVFCQPVKVMLDNRKIGNWVNGVPSGWRWTAILDTVLNNKMFRRFSGLYFSYRAD